MKKQQTNAVPWVELHQSSDENKKYKSVQKATNKTNPRKPLVWQIIDMLALKLILPTYIIFKSKGNKQRTQRMKKQIQTTQIQHQQSKQKVELQRFPTQIGLDRPLPGNHLFNRRRKSKQKLKKLSNFKMIWLNKLMTY